MYVMNTLQNSYGLDTDRSKIMYQFVSKYTSKRNFPLKSLTTLVSIKVYSDSEILNRSQNEWKYIRLY